MPPAAFSNENLSGAAGDSPRDPIYLHARREALVILAMFFVCLVWAVGFSWLDGYTTLKEQQPASEPVPVVWGIPRWVFWGVLFPWLMVDAAAIWFCFFFMANDDLGEAHEGEDLAEQVYERRHDQQEEQP